MMDEFTSSFMGPPTVTGILESQVFFDGTTYLYTQTVTPMTSLNFTFNTEFAVPGFTGAAGWSFSDAASAGASGDLMDFHVQTFGDRIVWMALPGGAFGNWNAFEPITFFFASTQPPTIKNYNTFSFLPMEFGTAQGLAPSPVPEPGSIALFGSGLVGLWAAMRRRRALKM
jgi:hypothetical protein